MPDPTKQQLSERLQKLQKLRELIALRDEYKEATRPRTTGEKAFQDVRDIGAGLVGMGLTDPTSLPTQFLEDRAITGAMGGPVQSPTDVVAENLVGPTTFNTLKRYLSAGGPTGVAQAGMQFAEEVEKNPVLAPLEAVGTVAGGRWLMNRALARAAAKRAASGIAASPVLRLPYRPEVKPRPLSLRLGLDEKPLLEHKPRVPTVYDEAVKRPITQPALPAPGQPVRGPGFVVSEPVAPLTRALRSGKKVTPQVKPELLEHKAVPLLEGPVVGPTGEAQFLMRKPPVTRAEVAASKAEAVRRAIRQAQAQPETAPAAFKKLAETLGGKKLSPEAQQGFLLGEPGAAKTPRVRGKRIVGAPKVPKRAQEMRPADVMSRKAKVAGGVATTALTLGSLLEPQIEPAEDNVSLLMGSVGSVRGAVTAFARRAAPKMRGFLSEARRRMASPYAQELMDKIEYVADPKREQAVARQLGRLGKWGFKNLDEAEAAENFANRLERKLSHTPLSRKVEGMFQEMLVRMRKAGVDMGEVSDGYFRRQLRDEIAQPLFDDLAPLQAKYEMLGLADEAISSEISKLIASKKISEPARRALKHLVDTRQEKNLAAALRTMRRESGKNLFAEAGWEKSRKYNFPEDFYERDVRKVIVRYVESWGKRVAEAETFGPKGEVAKELIGRAADYGVDEARFARHVLDAWSGDIEFKQPLPTWAKKWSNRYTAFAALSKIGFGFATLKNVFQTAISTAEWAGWSRTLKGIYNVAISPEHRNLVKASGALNRLALEALAGYVPPSKSARTAQFGLKWTGFHGINVLNQYVAGSTAANWIPELHALANGRAVGWFNRLLSEAPGIKQRRTMWARSNLKRMGVDYKKPLTEQQLNTGVYRFTTDTQLQRNVVRDPLNRTDPRFRPFWTLKGFGIRQYHFQKNLLKREVIQHKNLFPVMRLLTGGVAAGALEQKIEKIVRSWLSGRPPQESDKGPIGLGIEWLGVIGAWSFMTDMAAAENKLQAVRFIATPIQISEFEKGVQVLEQVWRDADMNAIFRLERPMPNKTIGEIAQGRLRDISSFGGTFPRELSKRSMTEDQLKAELSREVGDVKDRLFRAAMRGDEKTISRIYKTWLNNRPDRLLTYNDIGPRAFADWLIKKNQIESRGQFRGVGVTAPAATLRKKGEFRRR